MKALAIQGAFGLENLAVAERPDPEPGPGQVLVGMRAAGLNYRDLLTVLGRYNPKQPLPLIPCSDGSGEVLAVGEGVSRVQVGDHVLPTFAQRWVSGEPTREKVRSTLGGPLDGTLAERMVLGEDGLVRAPSHLSHEQAATLACAGLTAWSAVVTEGRVQPGEVVVVQGTGGVSLFALQIAQLAGARVIATSSSEEKLERARALGAWQTIHYPSTPAWGSRVKELTGGRGADLVVEVGGAGTLGQSVAALRFGGTIALVGNLAGNALELNLTSLFMQRMRLQGILVGDREAFEALVRAFEHHRLEPVLDRSFPWLEARAAFEHLGSGRHFGKVTLSFD
ncbi:MAG TPA: NAD(P)-dependent alcohol dehydrogenase [Thermoanaerobaculia bacterium]|nr:NAD(P)-dependent alcohol dehydrogenase [Thermoanaerobaculia bacterium]